MAKLSVSDPARVAATVLLPHVSVTTRMERRSTQIRLPRKLLRLKDQEKSSDEAASIRGSLAWISVAGGFTHSY